MKPDIYFKILKKMHPDCYQLYGVKKKKKKEEKKEGKLPLNLAA